MRTSLPTSDPTRRDPIGSSEFQGTLKMLEAAQEKHWWQGVTWNKQTGKVETLSLFSALFHGGEVFFSQNTLSKRAVMLVQNIAQKEVLAASGAASKGASTIVQAQNKIKETIQSLEEIAKKHPQTAKGIESACTELSDVLNALQTAAAKEAEREAEIAHLREENAQLKKQGHAAEDTQAVALAAKALEHQKAEANHAQEIGRLQKQVAVLQHQLEQKGAENQELRESLGSAQSETRASHERASMAQEETQSLQSTVASLKKELEELQAAVHTKETAATEAQTALATAQTQLEQARSDAAKQGEEFASAQAEKERLETALKEAKGGAKAMLAVQALQAEDALVAAARAYDEAKQTLSGKQHEVAQLEGELSLARSALEDVQGALARHQAYKEKQDEALHEAGVEIEQLQQQLEEYDSTLQQLQQLQQENEALGAEVVEKRQVTGQNVQLKIKVEQLQATIASMRSQVDEAYSQLSTLEEKKELLERMRDERNALREQMQPLQAELDSANAKVDSLEYQVQDANRHEEKAVAEALEQQAKAHTREVEWLKGDLELAAARRGIQENRQERADEAIEELKATVAVKEQEIERLQGTLQKLQGHLEVGAWEKERLQRANSDLQQELEAFRQELRESTPQELLARQIGRIKEQRSPEELDKILQQQVDWEEVGNKDTASLLAATGIVAACQQKTLVLLKEAVELQGIAHRPEDESYKADAVTIRNFMEKCVQQLQAEHPDEAVIEEINQSLHDVAAAVRNFAIDEQLLRSLRSFMINSNALFKALHNRELMTLPEEEEQAASA